MTGREVRQQKRRGSMISVLIGLAAYLIFYLVAVLFDLPTDDLIYWAVIAMLIWEVNKARRTT